MIDFNLAKEKANKFLGSEKKTTVLYDGNIYMLKYPDPVRAGRFKEAIDYKNNQYSEHIGCQIFKSCGFETQDTLLGYFTDKLTGKEKIVVACKDFTQDGSTLYEFSKFANQSLVDTADLETSVEGIYAIINESPIIENKNEIIQKFWDMFVVDALIGNRDRHFGNWGLLEKDDVFKFAPIYDCGSSLSAMLSEEVMQETISDPVEFKQKVFNVNSCMIMDGKKIRYHEIFKNPPKDLEEAIKRIVPKIDMLKINEIINTTQMPEIRKQYIKKAVEMRYEQIILSALKKTLKKTVSSSSVEKKKSIDEQLKEAQEKLDKRNAEKRESPKTKQNNDIEL